MKNKSKNLIFAVMMIIISAFILTACENTAVNVSDGSENNLISPTSIPTEAPDKADVTATVPNESAES
ncbi:MAG TPA: hypothetical protein VN258_14365, partial [Mobilitalea sp.]|nr:hypothetical protein [Mobilitalea sp.]